MQASRSVDGALLAALLEDQWRLRVVWEEWVVAVPLEEVGAPLVPELPVMSLGHARQPFSQVGGVVPDYLFCSRR